MGLTISDIDEFSELYYEGLRYVLADDDNSIHYGYYCDYEDAERVMKIIEEYRLLQKTLELS